MQQEFLKIEFLGNLEIDSLLVFKRLKLERCSFRELARSSYQTEKLDFKN